MPDRSLYPQGTLLTPPARQPLPWRPPAPEATAPAVADSEAGDRADVLRNVAFYMGVALVFVKFSMLSEIQTHLMGFKAYLLYIFGIPATLGVLVAGGMRRAISAKPAYYWLAFGLWMFLCVPFSFWKGKSFLIAFGYWRNDLLIMFMIAGLAVSWREVQFLGKAIAVAAFVNVLTSRIFAHEGAAGRLRMDFGAVSNANDFAAHLLLTLPFLILMISNSKRIVVKAAALLLLGVGVIVIVKTGSRGALLALVADCLFVMLRGNNRQRIALVCLAPVTVVAVLAFVPTTVLQRIRSFSSSEAGASAEALESSQSRRYLLTKAIRYAVEFPLFGLGPGQFIEYEGSHNKVIGQHGMYHDPHNSFVQAFAEMGVPGGILLIAAYVSSFLMVSRTYRLARQRPDCVDIRNTTFCIMLGMVGFCIAITFLNFTYFFYGPALGGMAVSVWRAANYEFKTRTPQPVNGASVLGANRFRAAAAAGN